MFRLSTQRWLEVLSGGIIAIYGAHLVIFFSHSGPQDGDQFLVFHSLQYWNFLLFGVAKQWTPLMCAGLSMAGEPQIPFMSLSMALSYAMGPLLGLRLATVIYLIAGWVGAYLYAGLYLTRPAQRSLAAALFIGNGFFFCRLGFGHFDFIPFLILPFTLWLLHQSIGWLTDHATWERMRRAALLAMLLGAIIALAIDGSPVAIIHLLFWIGLYAAVLSVSLRSIIPGAIFGGAVCIAALLDAGYLWPMIQAQASFPRVTPDRFTSVLSFVWFALLPMRGKVLPANGNGHELSVFIGPMLLYQIWRYRYWLGESLPRAMRNPLIVVSAASLVLGMGSLKVLHVPVWLSPFDLLRPLPGFRSIGVTGRYWGFLALPLSLLGAAALSRFAEKASGLRAHVLLGATVVLQLGFQAETVSVLWWKSPHYQSTAVASQFKGGPETIEYIDMNENQFQGQLMSPTRGISNCYDMDDFNRPDVGRGSTLIKRVAQDGQPMPTEPIVRARFVNWSRISLQVACAADSSASCSAQESSHLQFTLRQAYHPFWRASGCTTYADAQGDLAVDCPVVQLHRDQSIDLQFDDALSATASQITLCAWALWFPASGILLLIAGFARIRTLPALHAVTNAAAEG